MGTELKAVKAKRAKPKVAKVAIKPKPVLKRAASRTSKSKDGAEMVKVRALLRGLREECLDVGLFGLPWCRRRGRSPFGGSTAAYAKGPDLVVVFQIDGTGKIQTQAYVQAVGSALETEIRRTINKAGLPLDGPP